MLYTLLSKIKVRLDSLLGLNSAHIPTKLIKNLLISQKEPLIIDVGCNIGEFTEIIYSVNKQAKVIAFDINKNLEKILHTKFLEFDFQFMRVGLSNFNGCGFINSKKQFDRKANLSIVGTAQNKIKIKQLDKILENNYRRVSILKIDTEGNDLLVLKGAHNLLLKTDLVIFEIMFRTLINGCQPEDFLEYLRTRGFKYFYRSTKYFGLIEIKALKPFEIMTQNIVCSRYVINRYRFLI